MSVFCLMVILTIRIQCYTITSKTTRQHDDILQIKLALLIVFPGGFYSNRIGFKLLQRPTFLLVIPRGSNRASRCLIHLITLHGRLQTVWLSSIVRRYAYSNFLRNTINKDYWTYNLHSGRRGPSGIFTIIYYD